MYEVQVSEVIEMPVIKRIDYRYTKKEILDFEIIELQHFFDTRPRQSIESDNRINFWTILYISEGQGYHSIDFHKYFYKTGDIIVVQKNQVQSFQVNKEVKGYIIHINEPFFYSVNGVGGDTFLEYIDQSYGSPIVSVDVSLESTNRILIELIYREYCKFADPSRYFLISSLFESFVRSIQPSTQLTEIDYSSRTYINFSTFKTLVEENYMYHKTVAEYADMMNLSKKTINQSTRIVAGLSAKQYINQRLLLEIKRYLSQGDLMNYEIAELLGFEEASNMTNFFKRYEGISPKEFREQRNRNVSLR